MRVFFYLLALIFVACKENRASLKADNLKYSKFIWHLDDSTNAYKFHLANYIEINEEGNFNAVRIDSPNGIPNHLSGNIDMTHYDQINAIHIEDFKSDYLWSDSCSVVYDGFTYFLEYKVDDNDHIVLFIPPCSPKILNQLSAVLDSVIDNGEIAESNGILLDNHIEKLKKVSFSKLPPLPQKPPNNDEKLYTP